MNDAPGPIAGQTVVLRPTTAAHVPTFLEILDHPDIAKWWGGYDLERVRRELLGPHGYAIELAGEVVGLIIYREEHDPDHRHAAMDLALHPDHHGQGLGYDAMRAMARYLFEPARAPPHRHRPGGAQRAGDPQLRARRVPAGRRDAPLRALGRRPLARRAAHGAAGRADPCAEDVAVATFSAHEPARPSRAEPASERGPPAATSGPSSLYPAPTFTGTSRAQTTTRGVAALAKTPDSLRAAPCESPPDHAITPATFVATAQLKPDRASQRSHTSASPIVSTLSDGRRPISASEVDGRATDGDVALGVPVLPLDASAGAADQPPPAGPSRRSRAGAPSPRRRAAGRNRDGRPRRHQAEVLGHAVGHTLARQRVIEPEGQRRIGPCTSTSCSRRRIHQDAGCGPVKVQTGCLRSDLATRRAPRAGRRAAIPPAHPPVACRRRTSRGSTKAPAAHDRRRHGRRARRR